MEVIAGGTPDGNPNVVTEVSGWRWIWRRITLEVWYWRLRRWIPRLVWLGDEIDVCLTFTEDVLRHDDPLRGFFSGGIHDIQKQLRAMGIRFDSGVGERGRDWELDWSLQGPLRVTFVGRCGTAERRKREERRRLQLVVSN